ncbi:hypothetical protein RRG08_007866 [Elysia crispata]|uniref:Uncharacterized protein n=1 Tax=Elysia crispata TaxID=231223 RepID=A0AAE0XW48_9GAST|nr:hypothetical protein RRG08_007866 [Elysia crispata]
MATRLVPRSAKLGNIRGASCAARQLGAEHCQSATLLCRALHQNQQKTKQVPEPGIPLQFQGVHNNASLSST